ncbi:hypothetical protein PF008_g33496 [Phytophthora fragariae]|uniref:Uncharacterized protein n=1 Tax=Phytophthora fragariae TaxID=53985 RepID=A0A6G0PXB0_9STRA|nr:hypothetical protein PF008_g33496 [Phytophthora fragariae]
MGPLFLLPFAVDDGAHVCPQPLCASTGGCGVAHQVVSQWPACSDRPQSVRHRGCDADSKSHPVH